MNFLTEHERCADCGQRVAIADTKTHFGCLVQPAADLREAAARIAELEATVVLYRLALGRISDGELPAAGIADEVIEARPQPSLVHLFQELGEARRTAVSLAAGRVKIVFALGLEPDAYWSDAALVSTIAGLRET